VIPVSTAATVAIQCAIFAFLLVVFLFVYMCGDLPFNPARSIFNRAKKYGVPSETLFV
jgi:hypothetical protein